MDYLDFYRRFAAALPVGTMHQNLGGGTTEIIANTVNGKLIYQRGASRMYVSFRDLYAAYRGFQGQTVSSTDLRDLLYSTRPTSSSSRRSFVAQLNCRSQGSWL
jgi:hypothetical protein